MTGRKIPTHIDSGQLSGIQFFFRDVACQSAKQVYQENVQNLFPDNSPYSWIESREQLFAAKN